MEALGKSMKWIIRLLAVGAVLTVCAVAAVSQTPECTDDFKTATYTKWYENKSDHQDVAYQAATEYLNVCPNEPADNPYVKVLKKFKADYEALNANKKLGADFETALKNKDYAGQLRLGKQIVAANPDNTIVYIYMANAGLGDPNLLAESMDPAKKAIALIEAGKPFAPAYGNSKDLALARLNWIVAKGTAKTSPTDAIPYYVKAAKYNSDVKKDAALYNELAAAYGAGPVAKYAEQYQPFVGKTETNESKLVLVNYNQALDRQIDAMARATALADPANKKNFMDALTELYKARNKSEAGLNELVAGILSKPLPDMPTPITILPATSTSTPVGSPTGSPVGAAPTTNTGAKPTTSNSAGGSPARGSATSTGTQSGGAAKPAASPTPKPRQRRSNHRA